MASGNACMIGFFQPKNENYIPSKKGKSMNEYVPTPVGRVNVSKNGFCDNYAYVLKIVEKDPHLRLRMRVKEDFNRHQLFSTNKQYVKMQNEKNCCNIFW